MEKTYVAPDFEIEDIDLNEPISAFTLSDNGEEVDEEGFEF